MLKIAFTVCAVSLLAATASFSGSTPVDTGSEGQAPVVAVDFEAVVNVVTEVAASVDPVAFPSFSAEIAPQIATLSTVAPGSAEAQTAVVAIIVAVVEVGAISVGNLTPDQAVQVANLLSVILAATGPNATLQALLK
jgi:hypothetical protein